jgi:DNA-binding transcriptional ArsR family regulator
MDADKVFKALADPTRRELLDLLCKRNGQPLGQLCENLEMARQSALGILEEANLVSTANNLQQSWKFDWEPVWSKSSNGGRTCRS